MIDPRKSLGLVFSSKKPGAKQARARFIKDQVYSASSMHQLQIQHDIAVIVGCTETVLMCILYTVSQECISLRVIHRELVSQAFHCSHDCHLTTVQLNHSDSVPMVESSGHACNNVAQGECEFGSPAIAFIRVGTFERRPACSISYPQP